MKTFSKGLFTPFLGLTSLYSVNIQPNSKFHPSSPKSSGSTPGSEDLSFFLLITNPAREERCLPTYGPPTKEVAHPWVRCI